MNTPQNQSTRVLSVGNDSMLLHTREMVLQRAGYSVCSLSDRSISAEIEIFSFELVLLCHSIPLERAEEISQLLQALHPGIVLVRLTTMYSGWASTFDLVCDVWKGPGLLLQQLEGLSRMHRAAA